MVHGSYSARTFKQTLGNSRVAKVCLFYSYTVPMQTLIQSKGSGLGLALVRSIIKLSGGRLGLRSLSGNGSCFWVELSLGVGARVVSLGAGTSISPIPSMPSPRRLVHDLSDGKALGFAEGVRAARLSLDGVVRPRANGYKAADSEGVTPASARTNGDGSLSSGFSASGSGEAYSQSGSGQASSALRGIMDQAGNFELVARSVVTDDDGMVQRSTGSAAEEALMQTASLASLTNMPHSGLGPPSMRSDSPVLQLKRSSTPSSAMERQMRPNFIPLPSRGSYTSLSGFAPPSAQPSPSLAATGAAAAATSGTLTSIKDFAGLRILVVDDDFMTRTLMSRMLTRLGCVVQTAENGQVALDILLSTSPTTPSIDHGLLSTPTGFHFGSDLDDALFAQSGRFEVVFLDNQMVCPLHDENDGI